MYMFGFDKPNVPEVDVETAWEDIQKNTNTVVVDVRTPHEYSRGNIKGSINIPVDSIEEKIDKAIPNKEKRVYVYCLSGSRSVLAVEQMRKMGFTNVFNMTSGLLAWRSKGFAVTQPT